MEKRQNYARSKKNLPLALHSIHQATVTAVKDHLGAFIKVDGSGLEGLLHRDNCTNGKPKVDDRLTVKVRSYNNQGKVSFVLAEPETSSNNNSELSTQYKLCDFGHGISNIVKEESKNKPNTMECKWKAGDYCRAWYSVDNIEYETQIDSIGEYTEGTGYYGTVCYLGYGNFENVWLDDIVESHGEETRNYQIEHAQNHDQNAVKNEKSEIENLEKNIVAQENMISGIVATNDAESQKEQSRNYRTEQVQNYLQNAAKNEKSEVENHENNIEAQENVAIVNVATNAKSSQKDINTGCNEESSRKAIDDYIHRKIQELKKQLQELECFAETQGSDEPKFHKNVVETPAEDAHLRNSRAQKKENKSHEKIVENPNIKAVVPTLAQKSRQEQRGAISIIREDTKTFQSIGEVGLPTSSSICNDENTHLVKETEKVGVTTSSGICNDENKQLVKETEEVGVTTCSGICNDKNKQLVEETEEVGVTTSSGICNDQNEQLVKETEEVGVITSSEELKSISKRHLPTIQEETSVEVKWLGAGDSAEGLKTKKQDHNALERFIEDHAELISTIIDLPSSKMLNDQTMAPEITKFGPLESNSEESAYLLESETGEINIENLLDCSPSELQMAITSPYIAKSYDDANVRQGNTVTENNVHCEGNLIKILTECEEEKSPENSSNLAEKANNALVKDAYRFLATRLLTDSLNVERFVDDIFSQWKSHGGFNATNNPILQ